MIPAYLLRALARVRHARSALAEALAKLQQRHADWLDAAQPPPVSAANLRNLDLEVQRARYDLDAKDLYHRTVLADFYAAWCASAGVSPDGDPDEHLAELLDASGAQSPRGLPPAKGPGP